MTPPVRRAGRAAAALALLATTCALTPAHAAGNDAEQATACAPTSTTPQARILTQTVKRAGTLRLSGSGWCHPTDGGSRIGVKIDEGGIRRVNGVIELANGTPNPEIWAVVDADPRTGEFTADLPMPDGTASGNPHSSTPGLADGEHTLRLLSGSLREGDTPRTLQTGTFTVVADGGAVPTPPAWSHEEVRSNGATAWVERDIEPGGSLRIKGVGWTRGSGSAAGPSTIAIKLNLTEDGEQARRTGSAVLEGDPTIWALLDSSKVATDGSFETTLDLPDGLRAGQFLTVSLFSGKFASGDTQRTATTPPLVVGGVPWEGEDGSSDVECTPTSSTPVVRIENPSATFGGTLRVTGTGWCNPSGGGSRIGVKIDEGAISRLDSAVHANRTIWTILQAEHTDGTFTADITLPDGTARTSAPALTSGAHTLRLLSGSLATGDTVRTVQSEPFVVGRYRPNGIPEPVTLRPGNRRGLTVAQDGDQVRVRVPRAAKGDWIFLSAYAPDGSPRYPWGDRWLRTDARGRVAVRLPSDGTITGKHRLVAQSGELGRTGRLLGWAPVTFPGKPGSTATTTPTVRPTPSAPAPTPAQQERLTTAPTPLPAKQLRPRNQRAVTGTLDGTTLVLEVPAAEPGHLGFVSAYVGTTVAPVGGAVFDKRRRLLIDLGDLADREFRLAVQGPAGRLLGWYQHEPVTAAEESPATAETPAAPEPTRTGAAAVEEPARVGVLDAALSGAGVLLLAITWALLALRRRGAAS